MNRDILLHIAKYCDIRTKVRLSSTCKTAQLINRITDPIKYTISRGYPILVDCYYGYRQPANIRIQIIRNHGYLYVDNIYIREFVGDKFVWIGTGYVSYLKGTKLRGLILKNGDLVFRKLIFAKTNNSLVNVCYNRTKMYIYYMGEIFYKGTTPILIDKIDLT